MRYELPVRIKYRIKRELNNILFFKENRKCQKLANTYILNGGYKRIYFYHIRKAGGTSLNHIFLSLCGENGSNMRKRLIGTSNKRIIYNEKIYVCWNRAYIEHGNYFYAYSHLPQHELNLPKDTFKLTVIRDPLKRVLSLYKMLLEFKVKKYPSSMYENPR